MGPWMHGDWTGWGWMVGWHALWWVLVASLVVVAILAVRRIGPSRDDGHSRALHILEERYARGEIDTDEFEQRRQVLR